MTIDEFLEKLERLHYQWERHDMAIRARDYRYNPRSPEIKEPFLCCPITAMFAAPSKEYSLCARKLGLSHGDMIRIVHAADQKPDTPLLSELRKRLLKACKLEEAP